MLSKLKITNDWNYYFVQETTSTQELAREFIQTELDFHRTVFQANEQTEGRGRKGRTWFSNGQKSINISICLQPKIELSKVSNITLVAAISLFEILENEVPNLHIKWPNDLLIHNKKLAGILTECVLLPNDRYGVIIGIGININQSKEDFDNRISDLATSLAMESHIEYNRMEIIKRFLSIFEKNVALYEQFGFSVFRQKYLLSSRIIGQKVVHIINDTKTFATITSIDEEGQLILATFDNKRLVVRSGELELLEKNSSNL